MKPLLPYLVLVALFLAGVRLVNRQQQYTRSLEVLTQIEPIAFRGILTTDEVKSQLLPGWLLQLENSNRESSEHTRPTTAPGPVSDDKYYKRTTENEPINAEKLPNKLSEIYPVSGHYMHVAH